MEKPGVHAFNELPPKRKLFAGLTMALTIARPILMLDLAHRSINRPWTWRDTLQSSLAYATDAEGQMVRKFDATTHTGVVADPIADKLAMTIHEGALCLRGEQSIGDFTLRLFRDLSISGIRRAVKQKTHGEANIGANMWGKVNTATRMLVNVAATSPLAERFPKTLRGLQHASTGVTLASGAITARRLLKQLPN